jgi:SOS-response transcriptional repressor LexA
MDLAERIRESMRISGMNQSELASAIGISTSAVSQWMTGQVKSLKAKTAAHIAATTGVSATWLASGEGPMIGPTANVVVVPLVGRNVPIIGHDEVQAWAQSGGGYAPGKTAAHLMTDADISAGAFALEIQGEMMLPKFAPGDRIIIDPALSVQPGDFVVAVIDDHETTFQKYRSKGKNANGDDVFELAPLNPDYPSVRSDQSRIKVIGVMVEHRTYRRRT